MKYLLYALCATALFSACDKQDSEEPNQSKELQFRTYMEEGGEIRPMTRSVTGDLSAGYYLSGLLSTSNYPASVTYDRLMWGVRMNKDGTYNSSTEKKYFWAEGNSSLRHSFVAYSVPTGGGTATSLAGATSSQPLLSVVYTNSDNPVQQTDFLYSDNSRNIILSQYAPVVNLIFKHRMARVMVKLIGTGGVSLTNCQAKITYASNAVRKAGTVSLGDNAAISLSNSYHSGTYTLGATFSLPGTATSAATAVEMGDFILLPKQSLADGWASLTLTYKPDGAVSVQSATMDLPAVDLTSAAGKQYNILVNVIVESQNLSVAGVTLGVWKAKSGTIDKL